MKRKTQAFSLLSAALLATSCSTNYSISGTSLQSVYDGKMVYIRQMVNNVAENVDSCEILHGKFNMTGKLDSIRCANLSLGDFSIPVVLESGDISVISTNQSIKIEGTPLNDKLYEFLNTRDSLIMMLAELPYKESQMILEGLDHDAILRQLGGEEADLRVQMDKLETTFITNNFDNVLSVMWFMQLCNDAFERYGFATTTPQIEEIYAKAPDNFRNNKEVEGYMKLTK